MTQNVSQPLSRVIGDGALALKTPDELAADAKREAGGPLDLIDVADAIRADREQWAAWCETQAKEADTEPLQGAFFLDTPQGRVARAICVSAAGAYRATSAMLRGK